MVIMSKWLVCHLSEIDDYLRVSEDVRDKFWSIHPTQKVFECIDHEEKYIIIKYGENTFKCENIFFKCVPEPIYKIGDKVLINYSEEIGEVREIYWHGNRKAPYYLLTVNNKKKSRRFFDDELHLI